MTSSLLAPRLPGSWRASRGDPARRRLGWAIGLSAVAHGAVLGASLFLRGPAPPAAAPVYAVNLIAAPPGPRAIGVVDPAPPPPAAASQAAAPEAVTPPAPPRAETPPAKMAPAPTPSKAAPKPPPRATPVPATAAKPTPAKPAPTRAEATKPTAKPATAKPAEPKAGARPAAPPDPAARPGGTGSTAPRAGGGPEGGRGTDVANVQIPGLQFPFPGYLNNIVRQVALRFSPPNRNALLQADVSFLIHRDGSVSEVRVVRRSGNFGFDLEARGAVEAAGKARAFGPLPDGFRDDVLPVTFSFDPRVIR